MKVGTAIYSCLRWMSWQYEGVIYALQLDLCGGHGEVGFLLARLGREAISIKWAAPVCHGMALSSEQILCMFGFSFLNVFFFLPTGEHVSKVTAGLSTLPLHSNLLKHFCNVKKSQTPETSHGGVPENCRYRFHH